MPSRAGIYDFINANDEAAGGITDYAANTTADARRLQQARYTLTGGNDISATAAMPSQHDPHVTGVGNSDP